MKERRSDGVKSCHHYNFEKFVSKLKREGNTPELPSPFGRVRAHDFFFFICSVPFLFAAFVFCLQRSFFVCSISVICSRHLLFATLVFICSVLFFICSVLFLFAAYFFYLQRTFFICSVLFLFAVFLFYLQRSFFVCSVSFLFAAFLFCLQRFFFVCSVSFLFAACPLWAIVIIRVRMLLCKTSMLLFVSVCCYAKPRCYYSCPYAVMRKLDAIIRVRMLSCKTSMLLFVFRIMFVLIRVFRELDRYGLARVIN